MRKDSQLHPYSGSRFCMLFKLMTSVEVLCRSADGGCRRKYAQNTQRNEACVEAYDGAVVPVNAIHQVIADKL